MLSLYDFKKNFQNLLRPVCTKLANAGVTANQVTIFATILSFFTGFLLFINSNELWPLIIYPLVMLIRMALNAIDGLLAREHDMSSKLGVMLNELGDAISDAALFLPLAFIEGINTWAIVLFVIFSLLTEMTSVIGTMIGASRRNDGPLGKSDRAFAIGLLAILIILGITPNPWINYYLIALIALSLLTIFYRFTNALDESNHEPL